MRTKVLYVFLLIAGCEPHYPWPQDLREKFIAGCTRPFGEINSCTCAADYLEHRVTAEQMVAAMNDYNAGRVPDPTAFATIRAAVSYCGL